LEGRVGQGVKSAMLVNHDGALLGAAHADAEDAKTQPKVRRGGVGVGVDPTWR
jgi:hypothetical protein